MSSIWLQLEFVVVSAAVIAWGVKNIQLIFWLLYLRLQLIYQLFLKQFFLVKPREHEGALDE